MAFLQLGKKWSQSDLQESSVSFINNQNLMSFVDPKRRLANPY